MMGRIGKKTLTQEEARIVIKIGFSKKYPEISSKFVEFLSGSQFNVITKDQWKLMPEIFKEFNKKDTFKKYSIDGASIFIYLNNKKLVPLIYDEFYKHLLKIKYY